LNVYPESHNEEEGEDNLYFQISCRRTDVTGIIHRVKKNPDSVRIEISPGMAPIGLEPMTLRL
jgi:hypothetical protein